MSNIKPKSSHLIWLDLEMTGLNPDHDRIIEMATIVTDKNLELVAEGPVIAIHQSNDILENMDEWNVTQHTKSGLLERVKASNVNEEEAQAETIEFLLKYVPPGRSPLCGNSICQDRRFLYRYMLKLEKYFHYRHLDVSTLKILAQRWRPDIAVKKTPTHLALEDIRDSIAELRYYRKHFLRTVHDSNSSLNTLE